MYDGDFETSAVISMYSERCLAPSLTRCTTFSTKQVCRWSFVICSHASTKYAVSSHLHCGEMFCVSALVSKFCTVCLSSAKEMLWSCESNCMYRTQNLRDTALPPSTWLNVSLDCRLTIYRRPKTGISSYPDAKSCPVSLRLRLMHGHGRCIKYRHKPVISDTKCATAIIR